MEGKQRVDSDRNTVRIRLVRTLEVLPCFQRQESHMEISSRDNTTSCAIVGDDTVVTFFCILYYNYFRICSHIRSVGSTYPDTRNTTLQRAFRSLFSLIHKLKLNRQGLLIQYYSWFCGVLLVFVYIFSVVVFQKNL